MRLTYRTARVLKCIAERPLASNRTVAESAGVTDPGQISKLLHRLERLGLVVNTSGGHQSGEPNAWELTAHGRQIAQRLRALALPGENTAKQTASLHPSGGDQHNRTTTTTQETR